MDSYVFLLSIAIILLAVKMLGDATNRVNLTQVVGALLAGIILGPSCLGLVEETDFIDKTAEIGVILLMFTAGLDTDINEMKKNSRACLVIALAGVLIPLLAGAACYYWFFAEEGADSDEILKALFMGVILTATSVSITVEALREMGKLDGKVGSAILGAAVIDDIMGIIVLTVVISLRNTEVSVMALIIKILVYGIIMAAAGYLMNRFKEQIDRNTGKRRITTYAVAACFTVAFVSETFFGIADITGAYLLGLFLSQHKVKGEIARKIAVPSYLFFSPVFFAGVGIKVHLGGFDRETAIFSLILLAAAILSKVIGCGLGARLCGFSSAESLQIGVGMICRGEVALIVAQKGYAAGLVDGGMFPPVVAVVIATTVIAPIVLRRIM